MIGSAGKQTFSRGFAFSVGCRGQLAQLLLQPIEIDRFDEELGGSDFAGAARPALGKIMHARAAELEPLYPKLPAFRDLARSYDPNGKFRNEFLAKHVLG